MTESRPKRRPAWVTPVVAVGLVAVATWAGIRHLSARAMAQEIPALPDLTATTSAVARQLTEADARARRRPGAGDAVGGLAMAYHANAFHEHARRIYPLAARVDPDDYRWPYYQSVLEIAAGQNERAVDLLNATLALNPDYPHAWARLGELSFRKGRLEEAEGAFVKALQLAPAHSHATLGMARLAGLRGDWSEVVGLLEEALRADPDFGPAHDFLAVAYEQLGSAEGVRRHEGLGKDAGFQMDDPLMNELWDVSSTSSVLVTQAQIAGDRDPTRAGDLLRRAVQADPNDKDVRLALGRFLARPGAATRASLEEAKVHFEAGLRLDPAYVNLRHEYAQALYALGELEAAEAQWRQVIEAEPRHAMALMSLGQLYLLRRDRQRALEFYRRGLDVPPDTPFSLGDPAMAHYVFAKVSLAAGDSDAALESFRLAVEHNPRLNDAYRDHATLLRELGRIDEGVALYERAVSRYPRDAWLRLAYGNFLLQVKRFPEAREQLQQCLALGPRDARAHAALGFVELNSDNLGLAVEHLQAAVAIDPDSFLAHFHLGEALMRQERRAEAVASYETALRIRPGFEPARAALARAREE